MKGSAPGEEIIISKQVEDSRTWNYHGLWRRIGGVGDLHDAVADDSRNDATDGGEGEEEGLGVPGIPHYPPPRLALLPQYRHLRLSESSQSPNLLKLSSFELGLTYWTKTAILGLSLGF
ncbi:hypothetical protein QYF36_017126 [Acer negundo]|nr:hypothetical protein QYF36_017126 [Acer negundo]